MAGGLTEEAAPLGATLVELSDRTGDGGGEQPSALEQKQRLHREGDPECAGLGADVEEQFGGEVGREVGCRA